MHSQFRNTARPTAIMVAALALALAAGAGVPARAADAAPATAAAPETKVQPAKVAVFRLEGTLQEHPAGFKFSLLSGPSEEEPALSDMVIRLHKALHDEQLKGVMLDIRGLGLSMAQAQELGALVKQLRAAKKRVAVYSDDYDTATYLLASYADTVLMPDNGEMLMPGPQVSMVFIKGLLDKIHVQADMVQIGKYKGAEEPMTLTQASPEFHEQVDKLVNALYDQLTSTLAENRSLSQDQAKAIIDEAWLTAKRAKELGLVDHLLTRHEVDDWLDGQFAGGAELVDDYGQTKKQPLNLDSPFAIFSLFSEQPNKPRSNAPAVAVIYADGEIIGDQPGQMDDSYITPGGIRKALGKALDDRRVKAIVLRVDSPGGSATASDAIWQMLRHADQDKPLTVSMGRMAASGGYYISTAGRSINADPATIAGSIGVVGGKVVVKGLLDLVGVNVQTVARGKRAGMLSPFAPFTVEERAFIKKQMDETYQLFLKRVETARGKKIKAIDDVAQGRIFAGPAAVNAGLVDKIATLSDTIESAAKRAGIGHNYQVLVYPEPKTLSDILRQSLQIDAKLPLEMRVALKAVPGPYRQETLRLLGMVESLRQEHVMLALPVGIVEQ